MQAARRYMRKDARINVRLSSADLKCSNATSPASSAIRPGTIRSSRSRPRRRRYGGAAPGITTSNPSALAALAWPTSLVMSRLTFSSSMAAKCSRSSVRQ